MHNQFDHSVVFGVRYAFNTPAPAAAPAPGPGGCPGTAPARSYLVFFDWDKANLTDRARQIIKEAADNSTRVQVTRIEVNGYTDTSGTPQYNQGLSVRRAQAVAGELVRDGVPQNAITIQGFGDTHCWCRPAPACGSRRTGAWRSSSANGEANGPGCDSPPRPKRPRQSSQAADGAGWSATPNWRSMKETHSIDRLPDELLWEQVLTRQPGDFLYAVTTMGVFCRPGCPSPRPLRKNVRFFRAVPEAEAAGFRACKRCDPKGSVRGSRRRWCETPCAYMEASEEDTAAGCTGGAGRLLTLPLSANVP